MRHHHDRRAGRPHQRAEQAEHLGASHQVQRAGGLIGEDDARGAHQRAGYRDALLLPAGELPVFTAWSYVGPERTQGDLPVAPDGEVHDTPAPDVIAESSSAVSADYALADLEQVDFFIEQGLTDEASAMLDDLDARLPGHILVADRREKLAVLGASSASSQGAVPAQAHGELAESTRSTGRQAIPGSGGAPGEAAHDIDTHADLGIMEKTMERYGAAIAHFKAVMGDSRREVFALTMIGECSEALGESAEAIRRYQDALKRPHLRQSAEATQLYYQLGTVFYNLGDHSEALYYLTTPSGMGIFATLSAAWPKSNPRLPRDSIAWVTSG